MLVALLVAGFALAVALGPVALSPRALYSGLRGVGDPAAITIVRDVRLPRAVLALLVGGALGASGAVLQGTLRNPLAEPYLLGVSGGAAVGAVVAVTVGASAAPVVSLAAFGGAIAAVALVLGVARAAGGRADPKLLLMAGVVVGAFANAVIMVLLATAPANSLRGALWWMMGSLGAADWSTVGWLALALVVVAPPVTYWARDLDALTLGEDAAASLGLRPERAGRRLFLVASFLAAATVAAAGLVGFVGLIVPHMARAVVGARHRVVVGVSAVAGAALVIGADIVARTVRAPAELPLGAVTAVLGVPFFLVLLRRTR